MQNISLMAIKPTLNLPLNVVRQLMKPGRVGLSCVIPMVARSLMKLNESLAKSANIFPARIWAFIVMMIREMRLQTHWQP